MTFTPKTPMKPQVFNFVLPGITANTTSVAEKLLAKNNLLHDIYFHERKFHNHLTHHILAAYSLGAKEEQLEKIYKEHASYQRPLPPVLDETITRDNYLKYLGSAKSYTSYLRFFEKEIAQHGIINTVRRFIWSGDMLSRALGGALHPIIHIGYSVEFSLPGQAAEGLALAACTKGSITKWIGEYPPISDSLVPIHTEEIFNKHHEELKEVETEKKKRTILEIVEFIHTNKFFDGAVPKDDERLRAGKLLYEPRIYPPYTDQLYEYVQQWISDHRWDTREAIDDRLKELYTSMVLIYGASGFKVDDEHDERVQLDFFLMHTLTSSYFLHILTPHIHINEAAAMIQGHLLSTLIYYVGMGRPQIQVDRLLAYKSSSLFRDDDPQNWHHILATAVNEDEAHVVKVIRSIAMANILYGNDIEGLGEAYIKASRLTIDLHGKWTFGIGFEK
ncbi:hypothetical protein BJ944DRAFT_287266 [Cunninghamella echinulata]|nr:hypothetical protein BJ944DRAFT_287266 [Cunninghamella echinulata]